MIKDIYVHNRDHCKGMLVFIGFNYLLRNIDAYNIH